MRMHEPRYALPMVGRAAELAILASLLDIALQGSGQIVGISAEAGIGKSRLMAELLRVAQRLGVVVVGGECQSYDTSTSYLVWRNVWRGVFNLDPALAPEAQIAVLRVALARLDATLLPRLPLLGTVLDLPIPDNDLTTSFDAGLRKTSLESLLVDVLRAQAATIPLVVVLEDCHWIDPLSRELFDVLARAITNISVLMVLAYRPAQIARLEAPRAVDLAHFHETTLAILPPTAVREIISLKLDQFFDDEQPVSAPLVDRINSHAQGNPFYVEELINYLHDRGLYPRQPDVLAQMELPPSLQRLILSRIDQLTEQQQMLIKIASVIGRLFRAPILWGVHPLSQQALLVDELDTLSAMELTPLDTPDPDSRRSVRGFPTHRRTRLSGGVYGCGISRHRLHRIVYRPRGEQPPHHPRSLASVWIRRRKHRGDRWDHRRHQDTAVSRERARMHHGGRRPRCPGTAALLAAQRGATPGTRVARVDADRPCLVHRADPFITAHQYWTERARALRSAGKQQNLALLHQRLAGTNDQA